MGMPSHKGTYLVLLGAAIGALALAIPAATQGPVALSSPEPVTPPSRTAPAPPTSTTRAADPTSPSPTSPNPTTSAPTTSARPTSSRPPSGRPTTSARPTSPGNAPVAFRAVAGPACPVDASRWTSLSADWEVVPGDSWTGDGCGDRFLYSSADSSNYVQWHFMFSAEAARTCRIEVFVPDSPLALAKVRYDVADRGFTVDQKANRGRWARAVNVPVATTALTVRLDGDQGLTGVTAGPVRVTCT
jgi:hypothetical protein